MTPNERRILDNMLAAAEPIDSPMTCSRLCGLSLMDARVGLQSLATADLIAWLPPERRWELTPKGRVALQRADDPA